MKTRSIIVNPNVLIDLGQPAIRETHTEGPWKVIAHGKGRGRHCVTTNNYAPVQAVICEIDTKSSGTSDAIRLANARLISAAPALLQVARNFLLLAALHNWDGDSIEWARTTISKVEGNA